MKRQRELELELLRANSAFTATETELRSRISELHEERSKLTAELMSTERKLNSTIAELDECKKAAIGDNIKASQSLEEMQNKFATLLQSYQLAMNASNSNVNAVATSNV